LPYVGLYRRQFSFAVACVVISAVLVLVGPLLAGWAIDFGLDPVRVDQGEKIEVTGFEGSETFLVLAALALIAFALARGVSAFGQQFLAESIGQRIAYAIRNDIYDNLQRLSYAYHDNVQTGQIMSRATQDVENIRIFVNMGFIRLFYVALLLVISIIGMFVINWQLALVSLVTMPIIAWRSIVVSMRMRPVWMEIQQNQAEMTEIAEEGLSGIRVVKAFSRERFESDKFKTSSTKQAELSYHQAKIMATHGPLMQGISMLQVAVTVGFGAWLITQNSLLEGQLVTFVLWLSLLQMPVRSLGWVISVSARAVAATERVFELLDAESAVQEKPGALDVGRLNGHVQFRDVGFSYNNVSSVLEDIELDAAPGKMIALLGPTGSGKSTIVNLIPRFYDVTEGAITIDGIDVRDMRLDALRRNIGIVQQDVFLFIGTLRDNIAYGRPDATLEDVQAAAKAARIHDFIESLPYGYDEWVGENGVTLSGGQKQRVAIARTLLLNPSILIFDDSTASVDSQTEFLIQQALAELMKGRTTFVIAQRLRTVRNADEIVVLDKGRVVERGTHDALLANDGLYKRIYDLELKDQEEALGELRERMNGRGAPRTVPAAGGGN
jgi:ATP-binding cassette subfamily B protein